MTAPGLGGDPVVRGPVEVISHVRDLMRNAAGAAEVTAALADPTLGAEPLDAALLETLGGAWRSPLFAVEMMISGPGGIEEHRLEAGANGALVRTSISDADRAELAVEQFPALVGVLSRLLRFAPGVPPDAAATPIELDVPILDGLAATSVDERRAAFDRIALALGAVTGPLEQDTAWQLVQVDATWRDPRGHTATPHAACLRAADSWFVLDVGDAGGTLSPVTSLAAWENVVDVLPTAHQIRRPAST